MSKYPRATWTGSVFRFLPSQKSSKQTCDAQPKPETSYNPPLEEYPKATRTRTSMAEVEIKLDFDDQAVCEHKVTICRTVCPDNMEQARNTDLKSQLVERG